MYIPDDLAIKLLSQHKNMTRNKFFEKENRKRGKDSLSSHIIFEKAHALGCYKISSDELLKINLQIREIWNSLSKIYETTEIKK